MSAVTILSWTLRLMLPQPAIHSLTIADEQKSQTDTSDELDTGDADASPRLGISQEGDKQIELSTYAHPY